MYRVCPKCGAAAPPGARAERCGACGLVYAKWLKRRFAAPPPGDAAALPAAGERARAGRALPLPRLLEVEDRVNPFVLGARAAVLLGLAGWTVWFLGTDPFFLTAGLPEVNRSFMHLVDLVFHEAGHVVFRLLGERMAVLGGSLGQLLMPAIVLGTFLLKHRNTFGASVGLWWLGQSAMDLAPYIGDARAGQMLLLGGVTGRDRPGYHDWENILGWLGLMAHDRTIATVVDLAGRGLMLLALAWGGWLLYRQLGRVEPR